MVKEFPEWGCVCDLDPGDPLTRCTVDPLYGGYPDDCILAKLPSGRYRRKPTACQYWIKASSYEDNSKPGDDGRFKK